MIKHFVTVRRNDEGFLQILKKTNVLHRAMLINNGWNDLLYIALCNNKYIPILPSPSCYT